jgi:hypothetical protein
MDVSTVETNQDQFCLGLDIDTSIKNWCFQRLVEKEFVVSKAGRERIDGS